VRYPSGFPRTDVERNRRRLIETARHVFAADPTASLNAVAKRAGVGPGTLYRHFPTRAALLEDVYRDQLARLRGRGRRAVDSGADALADWLDHVAQLAAAHKGLAGEILTAADAPPTNTGRSAVGAANTGLRAARDDLLDITNQLLATAPARPDITAAELLTLVIAAAEAAPAAAPRLLKIIHHGWRA
jgi:AcrR family transcriptional regulator